MYESTNDDAFNQFALNEEQFEDDETGEETALAEAFRAAARQRSQSRIEIGPCEYDYQQSGRDWKSSAIFSIDESRHIGIAYDVLRKARKPLTQDAWLAKYRKTDASAEAIGNFLFASTVLWYFGLAVSEQINADNLAKVYSVYRVRR